MIHIKKNDAQSIIIYLPYLPNLIDKIRKVEGRVWDSIRKGWIISNSEFNINLVKKIFHGIACQWDEEINHYEQDYSYFQNKMLERMKLRGLSRNTIKAYQGHVERFIMFVVKPLHELHSDDLQHYLLHLLNQQRSHTNVNQVISAMKIFSIFVDAMISIIPFHDLRKRNCFRMCFQLQRFLVF
jgi:integrase/recombinase XerD